MNRGLLAALAALVLVLAQTAPAGAQYRAMYRSMQISDEDRELAGAAAQEAYESGEPGTIVEWSNEASGSAGTARLVQLFEHQGLQCRKIEHRFKNSRQAAPQQLVFDTCLDTDGVWKLL